MAGLSLRHRGFTLIELMMAVAIVGILAAVSVPVYQVYIRRAALVEVITVGHSCRVSVIEYVLTNGHWPDGSAAGGCADFSSHYVASVEVTEDAITVTAQNVPGTSGAYILTSTDGQWSCKESTLPKEYLPPNCR